MVEEYTDKISKTEENQKKNYEATTNFQIQYFLVDKKNEFKIWAYENKLSMKELLYLLIDNKANINKMLESQPKNF